MWRGWPIGRLAARPKYRRAAANRDSATPAISNGKPGHRFVPPHEALLLPETLDYARSQPFGRDPRKLAMARQRRWAPRRHLGVTPAALGRAPAICRRQPNRLIGLGKLRIPPNLRLKRYEKVCLLIIHPYKS